MMHRWVMQRYFGRQYLLWFLVFLLSLSGIVFLFEVAELMRRAGGRPDIGFLRILQMGIYKLPETIERILPFVVLFSGLFTFWRLTRTQELVIARSVGVSVWQFMMPSLIVTLIFAILNLVLINPAGAVMNARYRAMEMRYLDRVPTLELTGAGLWLRQKSEQKRYLLHADHVELDPLKLSPLMVFVYDEKDKYLGRIDAPQAVLQDGVWDVPDAWQNWDQQPAKHVDDWKLPTSLTLGKIQESMAAPSTISFWELPSFIKALKAIGLPQTRHKLEFLGLLSQPLLLCAMIFFAASFALRMNRRGGVMPMIVAGVLLGSSFYMLNSLIIALGANQTLPVALAAWAIPVVALALSNAALLHLEDG